MDINYRSTPTGTGVSVAFPTDFNISILFKDSRTGETILDLTGDATIRMSDLLTLMDVAVLSAFVAGVAPEMVAIARGLNE